ncbi:MAG: ABC transporter ATP-binding protein [Gammaproteobacteria bacterium]
MGYAIETFGISKTYEPQVGVADLLRRGRRPAVEALKGVTLNVDEGEVYGVLGPNGSGKTTLLKILSTILAPTSGTARVFGFDVRDADRDVRRLIALVTAEDRSFYWRLTARQNLAFFATLYGIGEGAAQRKIGELLELFELAGAADRRVGEFSTGMKQKLAIARGLLSSPRLLFLDEPTRGMDPASAHALLAMIRSRLVEYFDNTVILTTHIMREVEQLCERVGVLRHGTLVYSGGLARLRASVRPHDRYVLRLRGLEEAGRSAIAAQPGVEHCRTQVDAAGVEELDIDLERGSGALGAVLRAAVGHRAEIVDCIKVEQSLEETFRSLFAEEAHGACAPPPAV